MRHRVIYLSEPDKDLTALERLYVERALGAGWTDDLDFGVILSSGFTATPADLLGDPNRGHATALLLSDGRLLWLKYHA